MLFFPRRLDPILDRGPGDKDTMVAPQMPRGGAVRQAVLDDAADGGGDDAVGVVAVGHGQVQHVDVEVVAATAAVVLRVRHMQVARSIVDRITQLVQRALDRPQTPGALIALGALAAGIVPRALDDLGLGKILGTNDAFRGIGQINSWWHGGSLLALAISLIGC